MPVNFKEGDTVICVDADDTTSITAGKEYLVLVAGGVITTVMHDGGAPMGYFNHRFEAVAPTPAPNAAPDNVNQPHHYARFPIEPITFINANELPYNIGNVIKYACRYDAKNGVEDLRKAKRYLDIHIETLERRDRVKAGEPAADVWKVAL